MKVSCTCRFDSINLTLKQTSLWRLMMEQCCQPMWDFHKCNTSPSEMKLTVSNRITGDIYWVGMWVISCSRIWSSFLWGSCGMTGRVSMCRVCWTWGHDPDLDGRVWSWNRHCDVTSDIRREIHHTDDVRREIHDADDVKRETRVYL